MLVVGCRSNKPATNSIEKHTNVSVRTENVYDTLYYQLPASEKSIVTKDTISKIQMNQLQYHFQRVKEKNLKKVWKAS